MKLKPTLYILSTLALVTVANPLIAQQKDTVTTKTEVISFKTAARPIGYGFQPKNYTTGAISSVHGEEFRDAFNIRIGNALLGRLPGLTIRQNGFEPGASSTSLTIRGTNTYGFSNAPLVMLDGFMSDFDQLVPEEIEDISILKDASATAVYGLRAANGVVLVTTKIGKIQPLAINFSTQYGFQNPVSTPRFLDSYSYAFLLNEARRNDGLGELYTSSDLQTFSSKSDPINFANVDWYNEVFRNAAPQSNTNLNFKGGTSIVRYFASLNALVSDGLYKNFGDDNEESSNSKYSRLNFRSNIDISLNKNLSAQLNLGAGVEDKKNPGELTTINTINLLDRITPNSFPVRLANGSLAGNNLLSNPVGDLLSTGFSTSNSTTLQASFRLNQVLDMITPGLKASAAISFNSFFSGLSNKRKTYARFSTGTTSTQFGQNTSLVGTEGVQSQLSNNAVQALLTYNRVFGKHDVSAMTVFNSDYFLINKAYPGTNAAGNDIPYKTNGVSTRVTYVNNEKYIVEFSGAYQGSNAFAKGKRYGFTPAGSVGWIISKENFLKDSKVIEFLKLRGSYGFVGNENIGGLRFGYAQRYPFVDGYIFTGTSKLGAITEGQRANPNLTWEKEKKSNIGFEMNFANGFGLAMDVFQNNRFDILDRPNTTIPAILGYNGLPETNLGKVKNKGLEALLSYHSNEAKKLRFNFNAQASYNENEIVFNDELTQINKARITTGMPIGYGFGLEAIGFFTDADVNNNAIARPIGLIIKPGDIKYRDIGGPLGVPDGIIDDNDSTPIGNYNLPDWTFSLQTGVSYKAVDLNLIFQGVTGINLNLSGNRYYAFQNNGKVSEIALNRWTPETAATATYPRLSSSDNTNNFNRFSSFWRRDASYIKLRSAEIGYTIPASALKKLRLQKTRLFINGTNLFSLDHLEEADVEALGGYPALRTVSLGLNLHF
ncbi:SusC/RagA family TonB-linked outer membrane protein [Pedobacter psychroterrae]|uniref:SusC/RagA family TonB-linked outer membrane protein n=1 Tax=Pedobacter psychroterrae TaxID=2530453 RepID=A0A4R0NNL2_9SPHI|nr:SusC/RagA family TonB-linked outer membrane protein [Pedobacter psychroterrae]TCD01558.1 SusC/RagA family TonB-linked outer membrane protein [Pedobacter psychroterrae]